jgi:MFS transporter, PAT family, beta-lactamase induction signal transducer AmpG
MTSATAPGDPLPDAPAPHTAHPSLFLALFIPFGTVAGFLTVALAYQLNEQGVSATAIAGVIALSYLPHTWKFLWAPLVDTLLTRKIWYIGSAIGCGLGLYLSGAVTTGPHVSLPLLNALLLLSALASTFLAMSIESLMALSVTDGQRGRASGWAQAGNLGGQGIGGGPGLWLIQGAGWTAGESGALLGAVCVLCSLALRWAGDSKGLVKIGGAVKVAEHLGLAANARAIAGDLWSLIRSRIGILAVVICFLPIGSGAAQNLWSVVAGDWHADYQTVALVNGAMGGVISAFGCIAGGWMCDRLDRRTAYCLFGFLLVLAAVAMAVSARTSMQFVVWTSVYAFIIGLCYAGYSAVVLEAVGRTAAATKFSLLSALSNAPIAYMTLVDGAANDRWGTRGMLLAEAVWGVAGIALFAALAGLTKRRGTSLSNQPA